MKPFSPEADAVIENAFAWLGRRQLEQPEPIIPFRLYREGMSISEDDAKILREMAKHSGWVERGGLALGARTTFEESRGIKSRSEMQSRTHWLGQPEWAHGSGYSKQEIQALVEKAIAGERLGSKQRLLFQIMLDVLAESKADTIPF